MSPTSGLGQFSTCEISDALIKLSLPHGGLLPDINMFSPAVSGPATRICSPAYTVQMVLASDVSAPKLSTHFVDTVPAHSVVVINAPPGSLRLLDLDSTLADLASEAINAVWGGMMTAGAQARLATGVIISGRCRDIAEHRELDFPVFARGHSTLGQAPFTRPSAINVPLVIAAQGAGTDSFPAVTVRPGDWMVADEDGVVCVPKDLEFRVIELATRGRHVDNLCMRDIKAGKGVQASFLLHRGKQ